MENVLQFDLGHKSHTGKEYYWLIIDKGRKELFWVKNAGCGAAVESFLAAAFNIPMIDATYRFKLEFANETKDESKVPKKYEKFTWKQ